MEAMNLDRFANQFAPQPQPADVRTYYGRRSLRWITPADADKAADTMKRTLARYEAFAAMSAALIKAAAGKRLIEATCKDIVNAATLPGWHGMFISRSPQEKYFTFIPLARDGVSPIYNDSLDLTILHASGTYGDVDLVGVRTFTPAVIARMKKSAADKAEYADKLRARLDSLYDSVAAYNAAMETIGNSKIMSDIDSILDLLHVG